MIFFLSDIRFVSYHKNVHLMCLCVRNTSGFIKKCNSLAGLIQTKRRGTNGSLVSVVMYEDVRQEMKQPWPLKYYYRYLELWQCGDGLQVAGYCNTC